MRKPALMLSILLIALFMVSCSEGAKKEVKAPANPRSLILGEWDLVEVQVVKETEELYLLFEPMPLGGGTEAELQSRRTMCLLEALMDEIKTAEPNVSEADWLDNYEYDEGKKNKTQALVSVSAQPLSAASVARAETQGCPENYDVRSKLFYDDKTAAIKLTVKLDPKEKDLLNNKAIPAIKALLAKPEFASFTFKEAKPPELKTLAEAGGSAVFIFSKTPAGTSKQKFEIKITLEGAPFVITGKYEFIHNKTISIESSGMDLSEERMFNISIAGNELTMKDTENKELYKLVRRAK